MVIVVIGFFCALGGVVGVVAFGVVFVVYDGDVVGGVWFVFFCVVPFVLFVLFVVVCLLEYCL